MVIRMGIIAWIVLGLIAGAIAKAIMPGEQGGGWFATLILGVVGASGDSHVGQSSFLLQLCGIGKGLLVREQAVLET
ncbi:unnamed protein product, partial [marine sediment metagenome]